MKSASIEIRGCNSKEELIEVVELCDSAFPKTRREYFERHVLKDKTLDTNDPRVLLIDGKIVSSVQVFPRTIYVQKDKIQIGGIGNVATLPSERGKGYAGLLIKGSLDYIIKKGYPLSMLASSINPCFEKFGFRREDGYAGEFGHIQVIPDGDLCYCGKKGCLETVSSSRAIAHIAKARISEGATTMLSGENINIEQIDSKMVFEAANRGDQFSIEIIEEAGRYLGSGIAVLINLFNPSLIILGGGVSNAAPYLLDSIKSNAMKHSLVQLNKKVRFVTSKLGNKAGALGVAIYLARDLFEVEHLNPIAYV